MEEEYMVYDEVGPVEPEGSQVDGSSFSLLRVIAVVAAVLMAAVTPVYGKLSPDAEGGRAVVQTLAALCRWSLPVLVMCFGAYLLDPDRELTFKGDLFDKAKRIVFALAVFTLLYHLVSCFIPVAGSWENNWKHLLPWRWVFTLFSGVGTVALLYVLLGLIVLTPFFRIFLKSAEKDDIKNLLIALGALQLVIPTACSICGIGSGLAYFTAGGFPFYYFAGYAIAHGKVEIPREKITIILAIGAGVVLVGTLLGNLISKLDFLQGVSSDGYASAFVAMMAVGLFCMFKDVEAPSFAKIVDDNVFPTYIFYGIILTVLLSIIEMSSNSFVAILEGILFGVISFAGACAAGIGLKKVPWFKDWL